MDKDKLINAVRQAYYKALVCKRPTLDGAELVIESIAFALGEDGKDFLAAIGYSKASNTLEV